MLWQGRRQSTNVEDLRGDIQGGWTINIEWIEEGDTRILSAFNTIMINTDGSIILGNIDIAATKRGLYNIGVITKGGIMRELTPPQKETLRGIAKKQAFDTEAKSSNGYLQEVFGAMMRSR